MEDQTGLLNKKTSDLTVADTMKMTVAVTVITTATMIGVGIGVGAVKALGEKFREKRQARQAEKTQSK